MTLCKVHILNSLWFELSLQAIKMRGKLDDDFREAYSVINFHKAIITVKPLYIPLKELLSL